ncbi:MULTISPECIES: WbuC family cupin fold metalloprotein [Pseudomonas]|uniref:Cupin fold metalloprotein, WbuC family n=1 Tax=Pseudomonas lutea TaxID=243924 RepID=A0A9X8QI29_9PSED|nr:MULTISPECIES: WbuC family cupin fold metalloprotein [Pseudomonas]MCG7373338.1 WbuC family cupin fold metalloprotein [Pseudomonas luteola]SEP85294.1 cupin fold metalloprotein, WbuC family [Pseudomonas lutea]
MRGPAFIDQVLFAGLTQQAADSPRLRYHHGFHTMDEPCHRLSIGMQPDTYVAPHRHLDLTKAETLLVLKGRIGVLFFDEEGALTGQRLLEAGGDCVGVDFPPGLYHSLVVLETDTVIFECKAGPFRALQDNEYGPWAPREGEPGTQAYRDWMAARFES